MYQAWWFWVCIFLLIGVLAVVRNSLKYRKELGGKSTPEEIRAKFPKARIIPLSKKK
jgi:hypothetical protein